MVAKYLGFLVLGEAVFMLPPALVSLYYGEAGSVRAFLLSSALCAVLGLVPVLLLRRCSDPIYARDGFVIAGLGWVLISLLGALPLWLSGVVPSFASAFFESVAGFTTTGVFLSSNFNVLGKGTLFWRNFIQWLGGIGVLAFVLAVVRSKANSGMALHMFRAETPGPTTGRMRPKMQQSIRAIFLIYGGLSAANLLFLLLGGMPLFEAMCMMFGTAGTGGFGVRADSMASYSLYLQGVCTVFMLLFGTNFMLYYQIFSGQWRLALRDEELRLYGGIVAVGIAVITLSLVFSGGESLGQSLHSAAFMVSSVITSTGLSIGDYGHWPGLARSFLFILMIIGAMGGSTAGGFKVSRVLILLKSLRAGLYRMLHPRSVTTIRLNGKPVSDDVFSRVQLFLFVYVSVILLSFLLISVDGLPLENNLAAVIACTNNIGPGFGLVVSLAHFEEYSLFSKIVLSADMLLGRLEIFPVVLLFFPSTWRLKT